MKKAILILCVVALIVGVATAAMAQPNTSYWGVQFTTGWYNGTSMSNGSSATLGARTGAVSQTPVSGDPTNTDSAIAIWNAGAQAKYIESSPILTTPPYYQFDMKVLVMGQYGHGNQVYISAFAGDGIAGSSSKGLPTNYWVTVKSVDGLTTYGSWSQSQLYVAGLSFPDATVAGRQGFWYTASGTGTGWAGGNLQSFTVTVGPAVPEPGSMLALGSGMIGLVGFAIRRRRA
jgi:hypothetical protein